MTIHRIICFRILAVFVTLASVLLGGCTSDRAVIGQANQFHGGLEAAIIKDPELTRYFQAVGDRIIEAARRYDARNPGGDAESREWMFTRNMKFHLVNSSTLNAFTTGGEHMYIYNQLLQEAKSEDELAAVMAHEYAHVYSRHVQSGMNRQYGILGAAAAAGVAGYAAGGSEKGGEYAGLAAGVALAAGQFVGMSYTRQDETEADKRGYDFYLRAGWDPAKFGDFFKNMIDKGYDTAPELLSDHPSLKSRYDVAQKRAANVPDWAAKMRRPPVASAAEFKRLQQRAAAIGAKMPDDRTLAGARELLQALPRSCLTPAIHEDQKQAEQSVLMKTEQARKARAGAGRGD